MSLSAIDIAFFVVNKMHTLKAPLVFARLEEDVQCQHFWDTHHASFAKLMTTYLQTHCQTLRLDLHKKNKLLRFAQIKPARNRTIH
ncbi:hypothetical protein ADP71_12880 [Vitreoscilla sp. C1]|uniref:hypothetical protein n=1 Tax=Vitreoscilla sp. (strain C1) TaxID=96942 RepID=UPI00148ED46E|nr:hypothetical protein [Vitreoscilla sp. C1]AUZ04917.2 hypothetical protein ADP71_12880 [Vitreoscilla sp. C1]